MNNRQHDQAAIQSAQEKPTWQAPKLTKHGDIATLTQQLPGPDGLLPDLRYP